MNMDTVRKLDEWKICSASIKIQRRQEKKLGWLKSDPPCSVTNQQTSEIFAQTIFSRFSPQDPLDNLSSLYTLVFRTVPGPSRPEFFSLSWKTFSWHSQQPLNWLMSKQIKFSIVLLDLASKHFFPFLCWLLITSVFRSFFKFCWHPFCTLPVSFLQPLVSVWDPPD